MSISVAANRGRARQENVWRSAETKPVRGPAVAGGSLRLGVEPMAAALYDKHFEPTVLVDADRRCALHTVRRPIMHPPVRPGAIACVLPDVTNVTVIADDEQLLPEIRVEYDRRRTLEPDALWRPVVCPVRPAIVLRGLPNMPEVSVVPDGKRLKAMVGAQRDHLSWHPYLRRDWQDVLSNCRTVSFQLCGGVVFGCRIRQCLARRCSA
jgi:hypothetical protein